VSRHSRNVTILAAAVAVLTACSTKEAAVATRADESQATAGSAPMEPPAAAAPMPVAEAEEGAASADRAKRGGLNAYDGDDAPKGGGGDKADAAGAAPDKPSRSWFPETFLFAPLVVTDASGAAVVPVTIPDRLTGYRILALAHSRGGAQAGAVASLTSTLPVYVEPVVPVFLHAGDSVRLPVQVVNTTEAAVTRALRVTATGAAAIVTGGGGTVSVPARSSAVSYATLTATRPGAIRLEAVLDGADGVVRTIEVRPVGKPTVLAASGTLAAPRSIPLTGPVSATPGTDRVHLQVFPGALAILRSELGATLGRGGVAEDAFALLLAGRAPELLRSLGDEPDAAALRRLRILASQRVMRHAMTLDAARASLIAEAALAHPTDPLLSNLGVRAVQHLAANQLPDGTCGGETGWTLQRLLVATADCARAAAGEPSVRLRAASAIERSAAAIDDPYTAAALLAAGVARGELADALRGRVMAALVKAADGSQSLPVPEHVVRADGARPSTVEATALAILALEGHAAAPLADLGATVLGAYTPGPGWGDGRANLVAITAVLRLFKDPMPPATAITLRQGDVVVARGELGKEQIRSIVTLEASGLDTSGAHTWTVEATPAVPGLGFALAISSWGPWPAARAGTGIALELQAPAAAVGKPAELRVRAVAPAGRTMTATLALPAGVQADTVQLDGLVQAGTIQRYRAMAGAVELVLPALSPGQAALFPVRVVPTLAGTVSSGASVLRVDGAGGAEVAAAPLRWTIAR
jgi:hypothetical protein